MTSSGTPRSTNTSHYRNLQDTHNHAAKAAAQLADALERKANAERDIREATKQLEACHKYLVSYENENNKPDQ